MTWAKRDSYSIAATLAMTFAGSCSFAQDGTAQTAEEWSIAEFEKAVEYESGVRFPFRTLCTPFLEAEPKLPLGCQYGTIDVKVADLTTTGVKLLPTLLQHSTNGMWIDPHSDEAVDASVSLLDWGFQPMLVWQASGRASSAVCGYQNPAELTEPQELPPLMAATCFLSFPPWEHDELRVKMRFEAVQEVSSVFTRPMSEEPFLSQVTYFVFNTYSLGGF